MADAPSTYLVVGAGKFGQGVARALAERGCRVIAVDRDQAKLDELCTLAEKTIRLDATADDALADVAPHADVAIVSIGEDVEDAGVPTVVAKALTESHGKLLARVGADRIVFPERDMARKLAAALVSPTIFDHVEVGPGYAILETAAPKAFWGKSLGESDIRAVYGVTVIAIKPAPDAAGPHETVVAPPADGVIHEGDVLVIVGTDADIEAFRNIA